MSNRQSDKGMSISRRRMLAALGGGIGASALTPFIPHSVRAAGEAPKRLITIFHPMGALEESFWPTGTSPDGTSFTLGETQQALNDVKSKLIYMDGLLMYGADWYFPDDDNEHGSGMEMVFTGSKKAGYSTGPSIDAVIADSIMAKNPGLRYRSLNLGVRAPAPWAHGSCFFSAPQKPVNPDNNPKAVFDRIFAGVMDGQSTVDTGALDRLRKQKQSIVDLVRGDLNRACARIGAEEKDKCDAHLEAVRNMEQRLTTSGAPVTTVGCMKPTIAGGGLVGDVQAQMDLIVAAFTCDLTRVATLQIGNADGGVDPTGTNQHDSTHNLAKGALKDIDKWFCARYAYLIKKLDSIKEGNGTMLDNTIITFGSDTTTGTSYYQGAHQFYRFPFWFAGGGNFAFKTGRHLKVAHVDKAPDKKSDLMWTPYNRMYVSLLNAYGIDAKTFGNMDPGSGPLLGL